MPLPEILTIHAASLRRALALGLLSGLLCAPSALAGVGRPSSGPGTSSAGGSGGNVSAGDETVGTLPSVRDDQDWPRWLRPGDRLVLEGDAQAVSTALAGSRGQGSVHLTELAGSRLRAMLAGNWTVGLDRSAIARGELTLALEVLEAGTTLVARGERASRSNPRLVLDAGDLLLPVAVPAYTLRTVNPSGVRTLLAFREHAHLVALELRTR